MIKAYICKTAFDYELGEDSDGTILYPSIKALKEKHGCTDECGIVEVVVTASETIEGKT